MHGIYWHDVHAELRSNMQQFLLAVRWPPTLQARRIGIHLGHASPLLVAIVRTKGME